MKRWFLALLFLLPALALASNSITVTWTNPSTRTDGSPLTNLASITIFWSRCSSVSTPTVTVPSLSVIVPTTVAGAKETYVVVTTLAAPLCFDAIAQDANGLSSPTTNVVVWDPIPTLGKPETLGQPVILPPSH